ncbi:MAG: hypothetical protein KYX69_02815 [Sphingomonas sp.]|uniref:hypothetical protein n=1 Tax=Sphingomonas sp. TaxID=28214 RepID=UPI002621B22F|nr:hypothetical protein [Sphingomonas sp.]MDK2766631.1 hypothetical protein [Sphingomonas sp.]
MTKAIPSDLIPFLIERNIMSDSTGPTFARSGKQPDPLPVCAICPKAMWYRSSKRLRAFCRELRTITWQDDEVEPILECDGYEATLAPPDEDRR